MVNRTPRCIGGMGCILHCGDVLKLWKKPLIIISIRLKKQKLWPNGKGIREYVGSKMSDNDGNESPSSVAAFLIWQQPHIIYMTELAYRDKQDKKVLEKY